MSEKLAGNGDRQKRTLALGQTAMAMYRGEYHYGLWDTRNKVRRSDDECQIIPVPAIVSDAEWHEVQIGIANNARHITSIRTVSTPTMLAGIAKCGHEECGNALTIAMGKGGRYRYYRCSRHLRRGDTVCEGINIRDIALESVVISALEERMLKPENLEHLLADVLDSSESALHDPRARLAALHTERTAVEGRIRNIVGFIEAGAASADDREFVESLTVNRARRAQLDQDIARLEPQLTRGRPVVTSNAVARLGEIISRKLCAPDPYVRQGYARRFIDKIVATTDTVTISGRKCTFENAVIDGTEHEAPIVPSIARKWCPEEDSNLHALASAST
jgi:site-specific DNA recombinase